MGFLRPVDSAADQLCEEGVVGCVFVNKQERVGLLLCQSLRLLVGLVAVLVNDPLVSSETPFSLLITRETVAVEQLASRAISFRVISFTQFVTFYETAYVVYIVTDFPSNNKCQYLP